jgi:hypothetical protein
VKEGGRRGRGNEGNGMEWNRMLGGGKEREGNGIEGWEEESIKRGRKKRGTEV